MTPFFGMIALVTLFVIRAEAVGTVNVSLCDLTSSTTVFIPSNLRTTSWSLPSTQWAGS